MIRSSIESKLYIVAGADHLKRDPPLSQKATHQTHPRRGLYVFLLAGLFIVIVLAYRTRGASFRWDLFLSTLDHVDWRWLVASICLILLSNVGRALRWQVMLRPFYSRSGVRPIGLWRLTSDNAIGLTAGVLLGRIGEVVRPYLIAIQTGLPFSSQAAAWFLERMLDTLAVLLLCGYALARLPSAGGHLNVRVLEGLRVGGFVLAIAGAMCLILLLALRDPARRAHHRILSAVTFLPELQQSRLAGMLDSFSEGVACTRNPGTLAQLAGYTILEWAIIVASSFTMLHGFQATAAFGLLDVLVLVAFISLGSLIQVPGIGGGAQAASILALTEIYGVRLETASGIALLLWIVSTIAVVPFGLACAFHEKLNWSKLKLLSAKQILDDPKE
jgi:glycosyltransferase 2 family protein